MSNDLTLNLNQVEEYLNLLPDCFRGTSVEDITRVWLQRFMNIETEALAWQSCLWDIDVAFGAHLDRLGEIVGQPRGSLTDAQYRPWIRARQLVNRSHGTRDEILKILRLIDPTIEFSDTEYPLEIHVQLTNVSVDPDVAFQIIRLAKYDGVALDMTYNPAPLANTFIFDGTAQQAFDAGLLSATLT